MCVRVCVCVCDSVCACMCVCMCDRVGVIALSGDFASFSVSLAAREFALLQVRHDWNNLYSPYIH